MQKIVVSFLYYARAIDNALLPALKKKSAKQTAATKQTEDQYNRVLDYVDKKQKNFDIS